MRVIIFRVDANPRYFNRNSIPKANESREDVKISRVMNHTRDVCVFAMNPQGVGGREN